MQRQMAVWMLVLAIGATPAFAQTSQTAPPSQASRNPPQRPKKVWTNEDLEELTGKGGVTTAAATAPPSESGAPGEAKAPAAAPDKEKEKEKEKELPPEKDPKVYRAKLEPLRKQLADVEAKIKETQDSIRDPFNGTNRVALGSATPVMRPEDQLAAYEKRRQELQQQIDDLEAQARSNGIYPGDIR